jgi:uncharacterized membrane protein YphA (DoxX/SURF4 family)
VKAPEVIESSRLLFRRPAFADAAEVFSRYANDPDVTQFMAFRRHESLQETHQFLTWSDAEWERWPAGPYLIRSRPDDILVGSVLTAWNGGHGDLHIRLLGTLEAVGALMFLFPRTLRPGAWLLLLTIGVALIIHLMMGQWRGDLLVYAAGVAFAMVHGEAYSHFPGPARTS